MPNLAIPALLASLLVGTIASAQTTSPPSGGTPPPSIQHNMPMPEMEAGRDGSASSDAFKAANEKMMKDMAVPLTGDTDKDFVAQMIPHHQGAVAMAEVELRYGKDPRLKKLAQDIIAGQKKEIAFMRGWQKEGEGAALAK